MDTSTAAMLTVLHTRTSMRSVGKLSVAFIGRCFHVRCLCPMSLPPRGQIRAEEAVQATGVRYSNIIRLSDIFAIRKASNVRSATLSSKRHPMSMHPTAVSEQNCLYFHGILLDKHDSAKPNLLASNSMILFLRNDCTSPSLLANTFSIAESATAWIHN
jgi:hypothetical protein